MTIRSMFKTSIYLAAMLAGSLVLLAAGSAAQAGSGFHGFHHYQPPVARIPTGPNTWRPPACHLVGLNGKQIPCPHLLGPP